MIIEWNKVTWYSKLFAVVLFVLTFYIGFKLGEEKAGIGMLPIIHPTNDASGLTQIYENKLKGLSIRYGASFTVDDTYRYQEDGLGKDKSGVKFTIPLSMTTGTNLGSDSYLSIEMIPGKQICTADLFIDQGVAYTLTEQNRVYSVASSTGAGAGNRYEETVYAIPDTSPCVAIRYFIHYGAIENYPSTVKEFDKQALLNQFDSIRRTLIVNQ